MENLYEETIKALEECGKKPSDVVMVVSFPLYTDWEHFKLNSSFNYDDGYGCTEINSNLKIVGDNWWLEREEYDGAEWWTFKTMPQKIEFRKATPHEVMQMIKC